MAITNRPVDDRQLDLDDPALGLDPTARDIEAAALSIAPEPGLDEPDQVGPTEPSTAELLSAVTKDLGELVGMHVELAKAELKEDVTQAVASGRDFGIGAFAGYLAIVMLSFTAALALAVWLPLWAGFGIVTLVWAAVAGIMVLRGKKHVERIGMDETVSTVKEDAECAQQQRS